MLDVRMKDENTTWQEWYENNPKPRSNDTNFNYEKYGCFDDSDYCPAISHKNSAGIWQSVYKCPYYSTWKSALYRAYSEKWHKLHPSYENCHFYGDFKYFSTFKRWMLSQIIEENGTKLSLDKDILVKGNKVYSPETCVFVPEFINKCLNTSERALRKLPLGVTKCAARYMATLSDNAERRTKLGYFSNVEDAHKAWQYARASRIEQRIHIYSEMKCFRQDVADALHLRAEKLREEARKGVITTSI